jgi:hypothetical protein
MKTALRLAVIILLLAFSNLSAATRYVWQDSPSPGPPYTNWTTAAHVIQDAVDAAQTGDTVLVAGGIYATGGRAVDGTTTNRVAVDRAIVVESLMGPEVTIIQGYQVPGTTNGNGAIRCAHLTNGASLSGFTLTHGATRTNGDDCLDQSGGGLWCVSTNTLVTNCVIADNSAHYLGGGTYSGTLKNCALTGNSVWCDGGGACNATLHNCTLIGNSAFMGGGVAYATLIKCTLTGNSAGYQGGGACRSTLNNCLLTGNHAGRYGGGRLGAG